MREYVLACPITCEQVATPIPTRSSRSTSELKHCFGFVGNLPESTSWGYRLRRVASPFCIGVSTTTSATL